jgi:DNA polymerase V
MDIMAKRTTPDNEGVRIAELDEMSYRRQLWDHRPLTDFWRFGHGIVQKLGYYGIDTMGRLARFSLQNEEQLYRFFGIGAELIIDHAWGWEPCTIEAVKAYRPETNSISRGQVLSEPYTMEKARVVIQEIADGMALKLVDQRLMCDQLVLTIGYDVVNLTDPAIRAQYQGEVTTDHYGRQVPKHAHGTQNLTAPSSSLAEITKATLTLFDRIVNPLLFVRRLNLTANHVVPEAGVQLDLFTDYEALAKERRLQEARLSIRAKFGKNAILRGLNFEEGATARERNQQIGGHKA